MPSLGGLPSLIPINSFNVKCLASRQISQLTQQLLGKSFRDVPIFPKMKQAVHMRKKRGPEMNLHERHFLATFVFVAFESVPVRREGFNFHLSIPCASDSPIDWKILGSSEVDDPDLVPDRQKLREQSPRVRPDLPSSSPANQKSTWPRTEPTQAGPRSRL
jgi:hypothetical protein